MDYPVQSFRQYITETMVGSGTNPGDAVSDASSSQFFSQLSGPAGGANNLGGLAYLSPGSDVGRRQGEPDHYARRKREAETAGSFYAALRRARAAAGQDVDAEDGTSYMARHGVLNNAGVGSNEYGAGSDTYSPMAMNNLRRSRAAYNQGRRGDDAGYQDADKQSGSGAGNDRSRLIQVDRFNDVYNRLNQIYGTA